MGKKGVGDGGSAAEVGECRGDVLHSVHPIRVSSCRFLFLLSAGAVGADFGGQDLSPDLISGISPRKDVCPAGRQTQS